MNHENVALDIDNLKQKYGEIKVGVVFKNKELLQVLDDSGFTTRRRIHVTDENYPSVGIRQYLDDNMKFMPRYLAEVNENFVQPIGYVVLRNSIDNTYFCTKRLNGGDDRLKGARSIGIGGHVDDGEYIFESIFRELFEEVGLSKDDILHRSQVGVLYSTKTAVSRVHIGIVSEFLTNKNIEVKEKDRLSGEWITSEKLKEYLDNHELESWSELVARHLLDRDNERKELWANIKGNSQAIMNM